MLQILSTIVGLFTGIFLNYRIQKLDGEGREAFFRKNSSVYMD